MILSNRNSTTFFFISLLFYSRVSIVWDHERIWYGRLTSYSKDDRLVYIFLLFLTSVDHLLKNFPGRPGEQILISRRLRNLSGGEAIIT